ARRVLPVGAGVLRGVRAQREAVGDAARACGGTAPGADAAWDGDRLVGGGQPAGGDHRPGAQRRPRADGGAVPLAGRRRRPPWLILVASSGHGGRPGWAPAAARFSAAVGEGVPQEMETTMSDTRQADVLITGARPYGEGDPVDVLVADGVIAEIGAPGTVEAPESAERIEARGQVLLPGFVDLHTHLREPGREDTETVESGSRAAALGGYTAVFAMANTDPVADNALVTGHVRRRGEEVGLVDVHPVGAVTVGLKGERLAEMGTMAASEAQVRVFSDDGVCVADPLVMRRALEYSTALGVVVAQHAEEPRLTQGAQAHEGERAARLGYPGWPASAEESIVARDCVLARHAGARLHICHVSAAGT